MKKQLIKEAFRLQQLAGIAPINEIGEADASGNTKKVIFSFFDSDVENTAQKFQKLGFDISMDRREEGDEGEDDIETYYAELDLTDYDMMNIRQILDDCERMGLQVAVEIGDKIYDSVKDAQEIDSLVAQNPDLI
jgi:hypothetical protein